MASSKNEQMVEEIRELKKYVETYRPGQESTNGNGLEEVQFPKHLYIGLFGKTGCGKTSLINSLKFTVSGPSRIGRWRPVANQEKAGGHTRKRVIAHLEGNIYVIDNRGVDDLTKDEILEEVQAQIAGKRGYSKEVDWENTQDSEDRDDYIDVESSKENSIGCAVFVFSAKHNIDQIKDGLNKAVHLLEAQQGRYPVAVITNVDCGDRERVETLKSALEVTGISEIFEVANITKEKTKLEVSYQHSLLSFLDRCMANGDETTVFKHHHQKEYMTKQNRKEIKAAESRALTEKKLYVASGALITSATAAGAGVGMALGPVGSVIGAGVGAGIGAGVGVASLVIGKVIADA